MNEMEEKMRKLETDLRASGKIGITAPENKTMEFHPSIKELEELKQAFSEPESNNAKLLKTNEKLQKRIAGYEEEIKRLEACIEDQKKQINSLIVELSSVKKTITRTENLEELMKTRSEILLEHKQLRIRAKELKDLEDALALREKNLEAAIESEVRKRIKSP
jgi:hypothetical protein